MLELPSFHQWTLISLYYFEFLTLDLAKMILDFFSYFWLFWDFSLAVGMFNFVASCWYTGCVIYAIDHIR